MENTIENCKLVTSSNIRAIDFDQELIVHFRSGGIYKYVGTFGEMWNAYQLLYTTQINGFSVGKTFNKYVKNNPRLKAIKL
jgi:hypothetical protein